MNKEQPDSHSHFHAFVLCQLGKYLSGLIHRQSLVPWTVRLSRDENGVLFFFLSSTTDSFTIPAIHQNRSLEFYASEQTLSWLKKKKKKAVE